MQALTKKRNFALNTVETYNNARYEQTQKVINDIF